jgi:hypothetical protein
MLLGLVKDARYDPKVVAELNKTSQRPVQRYEVSPNAIYECAHVLKLRIGKRSCPKNRSA